MSLLGELYRSGTIHPPHKKRYHMIFGLQHKLKFFGQYILAKGFIIEKAMNWRLKLACKTWLDLTIYKYFFTNPLQFRYQTVSVVGSRWVTVCTSRNNCREPGPSVLKLTCFKENKSIRMNCSGFFEIGVKN